MTTIDCHAGAAQVPALSAEIFVVPLAENRYIVYAPLRRAAFVSNARTVNFLADLADGFYNCAADPDGELVDFLRQLEIVGAGPEEPPITTVSGLPAPTAITLFLTTACNLRCSYCYASAGSLPQKFMGLHVAKSGIDYVIGNAVARNVPAFLINYHGGGEPTLNWRTLTGSLDYAQQQAAIHGLTVHAASATNGLLSDAKIDWIIDNLNGVSLSFDGLPAVHDAHRVTASGKGSSARVERTMRRFDDASFDYGLRITVTADQITALPNSVEYICRNFRPRRIQVEPAYQLGRWRDAPTGETAAFIDMFRRAQRRAAALGGEITYSAARLGMLTNHFCGVTQDSFCLSPDGNVSGCYEVFSEDLGLADTFFYGQPDAATGGYVFDLDRLTHLRAQALQHRPFCQGCFAKWSCSGDCYHKALAAGGGAEFHGTERCHITRELTKDQILQAIAASGGLFWHASPDTACQ